MSDLSERQKQMARDRVKRSRENRMLDPAYREKRNAQARAYQKRKYEKDSLDPEAMKARRDRDAKYSARVRQFCAEYKVVSGCIDCGYNDHPAALDFDHREGTVKLGNVSRMANLTKVKEEIKKCDVRCANCHRIKTYERQIAAGQRAHIAEDTTND